MTQIASWLDFWTTNSVIWYSNWNESKLINLWENKKETRTVLFADTEEKEFIVGTEWIKRFIGWEFGRLIQSPKSFLNSEEEISTELLWRQMKLTEIIWIIIKSFKIKLENILDYEVESVVLWRPVRFHDTDKELDSLAQDRLEKAARLAWFKNIEFQLEPLAAAKTYQLTLKKWQEEKILIADLWWWTSDFSILNISQDVIHVIWNNWVYIWWNNFDKKLSYDYFCDYLWKWTHYTSMWKNMEIPQSYFYMLSDWKRIHELSNIKNRLRVSEYYGQSWDKDKLWRMVEIVEDSLLWYEYFAKVEWTKRQLSDIESIDWNFGIFSNSFDYKITRNDFEKMIEEETDNILNTIKEILIQSWLKWADINKIFLTWGSSLLPIFLYRIRQLLSKGEIIRWDSFTSVWYWLVLEAKERFL